jgi:hypothetical protein
MNAEDQRILDSLTCSVQLHMDLKAHERNYDNLLTLCTYATSTNPKFSSEGQAAVEWRDGVWARCYEVMADVMEGRRAIPTREELIAELPVFEWPM